MKTKLSGLMDGELAEHEAQELFAALRQDPELRGRWLEYQLIGDTLKGERDLGTELAGRVMAALEHEPTVLAPKASPRRDLWHRNLLALAATAAGIAVVSWLALGTRQAVEPETAAVAQRSAPLQIAATAKKDESIVAVSDGASAAPVVRQASDDMQEYLIAHEAQSSLLQFRGGAEHIRTVAAFGMATSK